MAAPRITLIPVNPNFVPDIDAQDRAIDLLSPLVEDAEVSLTTHTDVEFLQGRRFPDSILCPVCESLLDSQWWLRAVQKTHEKTRCANLRVKLPCCGAQRSLNDLSYRPSAGFARFALSIANLDGIFPDEEIEELERRLGCKLRRI